MAQALSPFYSQSTGNIDESIAESINEDTIAKDAFRIIDREVNKHKTCIVALLKRRNTFAPISRLPPDVLCSIFHFVIEASSKIEWIEVSHVSHAWRNTAVNTPYLWTKLPLSNSRWTNEMLSRSKVASLSVDVEFVEFRAPRLINTLSTVLHHASRIRHLHIQNVTSTSMQKILCNLPKSTPRLESLCLRTTYKEPEFWQDEIVECELPAESLCDAGRLSKLEIRGCKINWDTHLLTGSLLTSLLIQDIPLSSRPTTAQLWNALKRMPYLQYLDLQDALPVIDESTRFSSHEPIHFKYLQQLTIGASAPEVELFLKGISYLPTVETSLTCTSGSDFTGPLSAWSSIISPSSTSGISTVIIFETFFLRAYSSNASDFGNLVFTPTRGGSCTTDKYLRDVFATIPLGNLTDLHLSNLNMTSLLSSEALAETFGTLPHLHSVRIIGICAQNFVSALQKMQPHTNKSAAQSVCFPSLRSVSLRSFSFDEGFTVHMLQDTLIWRYEMGAEVQELSLALCYRITAEEVDHLRHIVVGLEWDGEEHFTDDEDSEDNEYDDEASEDNEYDDEASGDNEHDDEASEDNEHDEDDDHSDDEL